MNVRERLTLYTAGRSIKSSDQFQDVDDLELLGRVHAAVRPDGQDALDELERRYFRRVLGEAAAWYGLTLDQFFQLRIGDRGDER